MTRPLLCSANSFSPKHIDEEQHFGGLKCKHCGAAPDRTLAASTPSDGDRDGETYHPTLDRPRLNRQQQAVFDAMQTGLWWTLAAIAHHSGNSEASISARLRDLRKPKFGGYEVQRRRVPGGNGLHEYRLVLP